MDALNLYKCKRQFGYWSISEISFIFLYLREKSSYSIDNMNSTVCTNM